jgi:hypothetical protein
MRSAFSKHSRIKRRYRSDLCFGILLCNSLAQATTPVPRLLHPPSMAILTSNQPELRWELAGGGAVKIDLCRDRGCREVATTLHTTGSSAKVMRPVPSGVIFWRVRTTAGGQSSVWQFVARRRTTPFCGSMGRMLDVNGDGFSDVLMGRAVYLGSPSGLALPAAAVLNDQALQISSLTPAGDVNGDGYSDVLAAVPRRHAVYLYLGGPTGIPNHPSVTLRAPEETSTFGEAVAGVGDVNGDGFGDVVVGAPGLNKAYLYVGNGEGLIAQPAATLKRDSKYEHARFAADVLGPGDVNGDGYDDFLILSSGNNKIHVFHGGAGRPALTPALSFFGGGDTQSASKFSAAADVNEDGYADVFYTSQEHYPTEHPRLLQGGAKGLSPAKIVFDLPGRNRPSKDEQMLEWSSGHTVKYVESRRPYQVDG